MKHTFVCLLLCVGCTCMHAMPTDDDYALPQKQSFQHQRPSQAASPQRASKTPTAKPKGQQTKKPSASSKPSVPTYSGGSTTPSATSRPADEGLPLIQISRKRQPLRPTPYKNTYVPAYQNTSRPSVSPSQFTIRTVSSGSVYQFGPTNMSAPGNASSSTTNKRQAATGSFSSYGGTYSLTTTQTERDEERMSSASRRMGVVYQAFDQAVPSDYSAVGRDLAESNGRQLRKGKILGPDTDPAQQFPIGEAWVLALFAMLFGSFVWIRKRKHAKDHEKTINQEMLLTENTMEKSNFLTTGKNGFESLKDKGLRRYTQGVRSRISRFRILCTIMVLLFTFGVGEMRANDATNARIYFDNTNTGWSYVQLVGGHNSWSSGTALSLIDGTNNLWTNTWSWGGYTYFMFIEASGSWPGEGNEAWNRKGDLNYSATISDNVGSNTYLYAPTSSSKNTSYDPSGSISGYSALNYNQTIYQCVSENGGAAAKSTASIATVSITTKKLKDASSTQDNNGSIGSGNNSITKSAARTATVTMTATSINSNYAWLGWYDAESGGSQLESSTTYTYQASAAKTVYARFSHETSHTVTVSYTCASPSATVSTATTPAIGEVTYSSQTAPTVKGYTFVNWTLGTGLSKHDSDNLTSNPIRVKTLSSGTYTLTANYNEDLSSTCVLKGGFDSWGTGEQMSKKTGHSTEDWVYCTHSFTGTENTTAIKIYDGSAWHGAADAVNTLTKQTESLTSTNWDLSSPGENINFKHNWTGEYEFAYNTSTNKFYVTYPEFDQLRISAASPTDATNTNNFDLGAAVSDVRSVTRTLNANTTYTFKIVYLSDWYGNNSGAFTRSNSTSSNSITLNTSGGDLTLTTDYGGSYTFNFNTSTKVLSITYPTAYKVTYGKGSVDGSASNCSAVDIDNSRASVTSNSTWVLNGHKVELTAPTEKTGYGYDGWFDNDGGSGVAITTNKVCTLTVNSAKTAYACYHEIGRTVTVQSNDATNAGTVASSSVTGYKDTKVTLPTATAKPGYYFVNWTVESGSASIDNATSATAAKVYNLTAAATIQANFAPIWRVAYSGDTYNTENHKITTITTSAGVMTSGSVTIDLNANTDYALKIYNSSTEHWWGKTSTVTPITYANQATAVTLTESNGNNQTFHTAGKGTYTFTWDVTNSKISITYPTSYTVTFGSDGHASSVTASVESSGAITSGQYAAADKDVTFTQTANTGYTFKGWYTEPDGNTTVTGMGTSDHVLDDIAANATVYAQYNAKTYTVTLNQQTDTAGYSASGSTSLTATYDAAFPSITKPTAANGWAFMGYYSAARGKGTQFTDNNGALLANITGYSDASGNWIYDDDLTLYAYFKKAEITAITLDEGTLEPVGAGEGTGAHSDSVYATPTVAPTPVGATQICWELLYDNNNPVVGHSVDHIAGGNRVRCSIVGLAPGSYKLKATLRTGSNDCGSGTELSTFSQSFTIASDFTVTVEYKLNSTAGISIKAPTSAYGRPLEWTEITAPEVVGYTFSKWKAGEGITIDGADENGEKTSATIDFKASFAGTLTAIYTKRKTIYFNNTLDWSDVWIYFYSNNKYWDTDKTDTYNTEKGCGTKTTWEAGDKSKPYTGKYGHMTNIAGTNVWYFDYLDSIAEAGWPSAIEGYTNIAFCKEKQDNYDWFYNTEVVRIVDGFTQPTALPMYVPLKSPTQIANQTGASTYTTYYLQGYWMNYPENTGYWLKIFDKKSGSPDPVCVQDIPFQFSEDKTLPMSLTAELDANTTYGYKIYRNDGTWWGNSGTMKVGNSCDVGESNWKFASNESSNCGLKTSAAGDYTFTLGFHKESGEDNYTYHVGVHYPVSQGSYRIYYTDNAEWSKGSAHTSGWYHPSRVIYKETGAIDTVSFFVSIGSTISMKFQYIANASDITAEGIITWTDVPSGSINLSAYSSIITEAGVYNFITEQTESGISVIKVEPYTGNYYIRCGALNSKWINYRTDKDHLMTYSSFSENRDLNTFGELYSHYKAKWCPRGVNVMFCIANDYSHSITDTLIQDAVDTYENIYYNDLGGRPDGELKAQSYDWSGNITSSETGDRYSANIRFMWNWHTNKISRAYVSSATDYSRLFLVLRGGSEVRGDDDEAISDQDIENGIILEDKQNWMYERTLKINPGTKFKLFACYADATPTEARAQYFRGNYADDAFDAANTVVLIDGTSGTYQKARVIYDFKTNRLMAAWIPSGADVSGNIAINADVLVEREHQEAAQYVTFANSDSKLSGVKTVYGAMKFNRWILNNRSNSGDDDPDHGRTAEQIATHHPPLAVGNQKSIYERSLYFISFPFDVNVSEIFGFGRYWDEWYLEYYDGLKRAREGYWIDSEPNWKYITPEMATDYVLKAYEGYILGLDLDYLQADNFTFWSNGISTVELFFPSTTNIATLQQTNCTIPALDTITGDPYRCTINRGDGTEGDRRVKDSYWRCIGVPSLNIYESALHDSNGNPITWQPNGNSLPFIYTWNKTDNTLTVQSTSAFTFLPMHSYLVQNGGEIRWTNVSAKPAGIVARRENDMPATAYDWRLALQMDSTFVDHTFIRMSNQEQITDTFDFGQDLIKEFNKTRSNIYSYIGYERVAANSMSLHTEQNTTVPIGLNIVLAGNYTFSMPDGTDGVGITLIDNATNTRTNLSAGMEYTVTLAKGDYINRFFLEISPVPTTPTGVEQSAVNSQPSSVRKMMIDGVMYIVKDGKMYDARGVRIE